MCRSCRATRSPLLHLPFSFSLYTLFKRRRRSVCGASLIVRVFSFVRPWRSIDPPKSLSFLIFFTSGSKSLAKWGRWLSNRRHSNETLQLPKMKKRIQENVFFIKGKWPQNTKQIPVMSASREKCQRALERVLCSHPLITDGGSRHFCSLPCSLCVRNNREAARQHHTCIHNVISSLFLNSLLLWRCVHTMITSDSSSRGFTMCT